MNDNFTISETMVDHAIRVAVKYGYFTAEQAKDYLYLMPIPDNRYLYLRRLVSNRMTLPASEMVRVFLCLFLGNWQERGRDAATTTYKSR